MAQRGFTTGAMIIAATAIASHANANQTVSAWTGAADRASAQPLVSAIVHLDEDIIGLGGLRSNADPVILSQTQSISMEPVTVTPLPKRLSPGCGDICGDTLSKPVPGVGGSLAPAQPGGAGTQKGR